MGTIFPNRIEKCLVTPKIQFFKEGGVEWEEFCEMQDLQETY